MFSAVESRIAVVVLSVAGGSVDLVIGPMREPSAGLYRQVLFHERLVVYPEDGPIDARVWRAHGRLRAAEMQAYVARGLDARARALLATSINHQREVAPYRPTAVS